MTPTLTFLLGFACGAAAMFLTVIIYAAVALNGRLLVFPGFAGKRPLIPSAP